MLPPTLRLAAARHSLELMSAADLVAAADAALTRGLYSYSLGELSTLRSPRLADAAPLFASALRELGTSPPSEEEAVLLLLKHYVWGLAEGVWPPAEVLSGMMEELLQAGSWETLAPSVAAACGCQELVDWAYEYDYLTDMAAEGYVSAEELAEQDRQVNAFASRWSLRHLPDRTDPAWLRWNGGCAAQLACTIDADGAFDDLPILADALEDAGCAVAEILDHCRAGAAHAHRCWAVDWLLGREPASSSPKTSAD
jgi:hypothetical protein